MPAETNNKEQVPGTAFLGLQPYSEEQTGSFFGRDEEIDKLTTLIRVNNLTLVFGKSGTGKTSLLNAGVFPKVRENYCLPFRIRLEFNENSPNLVLQIKKIFKEEINKKRFKVQSYPETETLWEYFHKEPLWQMITPIMVFDQFEEIFTLAKQNPRYATTGTELTAFWEELSDIIENNIPETLREQFLNNKDEIEYNYKSQKAKVVFSFREEYLPEFETIISKIPSIKYSRFRLMPLKSDKAMEVITKTWKENIAEPQAKKIISSYLTTKNDLQNYVEPSLLSQVCFYIENKRSEKEKRLISENTNLNVENQILEAETEKFKDGKKKLIAKNKIETNKDKIAKNDELIKGGVNEALLNENKEETTLSSIYNEAVNSAEDALPETRVQKLLNKLLYKKPVQKLNLKSNRIKLFLEDKLIDPKGNRIPYTLKEKEEEEFRKGISILTDIYIILREDDKRKVIELTHDVIAPRIMDDREKRLRKRRNRILTILGFLIIPSLFVFAFFTYEAKIAKSKRDDVNADKNRLESLVKSLKQDSARLSKKVPVTEDKKESTNGNKKTDSVVNNESDIDSIRLLLRKIDTLNNTIDSLNAQIKGLEETSIKLIAENKNLIDQNKKLIAENKSLIARNKKLIEERNGLIIENNKLRKENDRLSNEIDRLNKEIDRLSKENDLKSRKIKELESQLAEAKKILDACMKEKDYTYVPPPPSPCPNIDTKNSLRLTIRYTRDTIYYPTISPEKINIYMIPYNDDNMQIIRDNMKIIRRAKVYDYYDFNEAALDSAKGSKKAKYCNGFYYFPNSPGDIKEGKYLIKVCTLYGAYKIYNLKKGGNPNLYIDAVPPVR